MSAEGSHGTAIRNAPPRTRQVAPSRRRSHAGRWIVVPLIVLIVAGLSYWGWTKWKTAASTEAASKEAKGAHAIPVVASPARQGNLPIYLNGLGTVTPFNLVTVTSRVGGEIVKIAFKEGQDVKAGDPLAEIDPRPYQVQLEEAQGQLAKDQAALNNAQADLKRYQSAGAGVTQQQIDTAEAAVREDEATVKSDQGGIDSAKLNLAYCQISAPITGRIGLRKVDLGNIIQANDPNGIAVITQLQPIAVLFSIWQDDAVPVLQKPNGGIGLPVDAFDSDMVNQLASGTISAINNQIDPTTDTLQMKASFANTNNVLYPNEFVNARLLVNTLKDAILVPSAAVQHGPDGDFLYVVKPNQTVEVRKATIGPTTGDLTAITEGLKPGETVVVSGVDKLQPGSKVAVREGSGGGATTRSSTTRPSHAGGLSDVSGAASQPAGVGGGQGRAIGGVGASPTHEE